MKDIPTPRRVIEMNRKRRIGVIRTILLFLILVLTLVGAIAFFSFNSRLTINKVIVEGTSIISSSDIINRVETQLKGRNYRIFSRANSYIYPQKEIYDDLLATFPRIERLSIFRDNKNTLRIIIEERLGSYLYCGKDIPEERIEEGENCFFVNNDGYIFDRAPYFSGSVYFKYYLTLDNQSIILGQNIIEEEHFHKVVKFIDEIKKLGFDPISLKIDEEGIYSLYLDHDTEKTIPKIIFREDNDLEKILNNLIAAMNKSEFADQVKSKYSTLLYIDLKFKNKVLYKFE